MNFADVFFSSGDGLTLYARDYPGPAADAPVVVCVHGLTRNSKDFRELAEHLQDRVRVVVPDMRGRGRSARDADPSRYQLPRYAADVAALLDRLGIESAHFIGTSMGGLISLALLAAEPWRVRSLVINDIGPEVDPAGIARIAGYVGHGMSAPDWTTAAAQVRGSNASAFPDYQEADWLAMARDLFVQHDDSVELDYDPAIAAGLANGSAAPDLWPLYRNAEPRPLLVLRGELTDLLKMETVESMRTAWPEVGVAHIARRGHAPTLNEADARIAIDAFLRQQLRR